MAQSQTERTATLRLNRRRVELLIKADSPEAEALDSLTAKHGSAAAAVRWALLACQAPRALYVPPGADLTRPAKAARPEPSGTGRRDTPNLKPTEPAKVPHVHLGPAPLKPGSRLKSEKKR